MTQYRVVAPVVVCKARGNDGKLAYRNIQKGGIIPPEASEDWIGFHLRDKMIVALPEPEPAPVAAPKPPEPHDEAKATAGAGEAKVTTAARRAARG